jgi:glycerol uptake facilitator-like aquaporin
VKDSDLIRRAVAEGVGTALLLATVVGSGIMADRLSGGNAALALLANSLATGLGLAALILTFGPISGAHFNPLVTIANLFLGDGRLSETPVYLGAQLTGAFAGVAVANAMFGLPLFSVSRHARSGGGLLLGEVVATGGLLLVIFGTTRSRPLAVPWAVGLYITAAYWFTSSTSFANPAVTLARSVTDSFTGIRPADSGPFILAEVVGAIGAVGFLRWLLPRRPAIAGTATGEVPEPANTTRSGSRH